VFQTAKGELRQITLADGSLVELNSDTELPFITVGSVGRWSWCARSLV